MAVSRKCFWWFLFEAGENALSVGCRNGNTSYVRGRARWLHRPSCDESYSFFLVGTVFALGVGSVICFNPFSGGFVGWPQGGSGPDLRGTRGRTKETLGVPLISTRLLAVMAVVARNSTLLCLKGHLLIRKTGDEKWRHTVVVGIPLGIALWFLTPGRSIQLLHFRADFFTT